MYLGLTDPVIRKMLENIDIFSRKESVYLHMDFKKNIHNLQPVDTKTFLKANGASGIGTESELNQKINIILKNQSGGKKRK